MRKILKKLKILFFLTTLERFPNLFRPKSTPFISGDTFRAKADHIFDETKSFNPKKIKFLDLVFLNTDFLEVYFETIHKKINTKYILITHNSDRSISSSEMHLADEKIVHWFAQNLCIPENEKITAIPIGIENLRRLKNGRKKWFNKKPPVKKKSILAAFDVYTNYSERNLVIENLKNNVNIDFLKFDSSEEYFNAAKEYRFILCPPGNGKDTHRIWECLLLGVVPIVKVDEFSSNFFKKGIPILLVDNWGEINKYDQTELENLYNDLCSNPRFFEYSSSKYWLEKIIDFREKYIFYNQLEET